MEAKNSLETRVYDLIISFNGPVTFQELCKEVNFKPFYVNRAVRGLVRKKYLTKSKGENFKEQGLTYTIKPKPDLRKPDDTF